MEKNSSKPPVTNRGAVNTENDSFGLINQQKNDLGQYVLIDWFQFTILYNQENIFIGEKTTFNEVYCYMHDNKFQPNFRELAYHYFKELFNLDSNFVLFEDIGLNGYEYRYVYKSIEMYFSKRVEMGINVKLSGQGCRDFEELGLTWYGLVDKLDKLMINYNRIDIAIDDYTNKYFTLSKLRHYISKCLVVSKFHSSLSLLKSSINDGSILGDQIQLGSKASRIQITFYDKILERESENRVIDKNIKYWTRTELRFRQERADELINYLKKGQNINELAKGILTHYVNFVYDNGDSNKSRWPLQKFWSEYLENVSKLQLTTHHPESSITKKKEWLNRATAKSQLIVLLSSIDNISLDEVSIDFIKDLLLNGHKTFSDKDLQIINDYRLEKKMIPLTKSQINDYVRDIKDVILLRE